MNEILPIYLGKLSGNCYLVKNDQNYILIDTGLRSKRKTLLKELEKYGCHLGNLKLIIITHGDFDHTGNCAFFQTKFRCPIAIHKEDSPMVERGDMFINRTKGNKSLRILINKVFNFERFTPDLLLEDGNTLQNYGINATIFHIPGHSKGSIGILTADGHFFCGDLFDNTKTPEINPIMDNPEEALKSVIKLKALEIKEIYPGHGKPFSVIEFKNFETESRDHP